MLAKVKEMWKTQKDKMQSAKQMYVFLAFIFGMNAILFLSRIHYFRDMLMLNTAFTDGVITGGRNVYYIYARASGTPTRYHQIVGTIIISFDHFLLLAGLCLNFSSMLVIVLVLRYTITKCRNMGLTKYLPLDNNIYLHKVTGLTIFVLAWLHTIMHLCNFCKLSKWRDGCSFCDINLFHHVQNNNDILSWIEL